jgi:outer membrane protein
MPLVFFPNFARPRRLARAFPLVVALAVAAHAQGEPGAALLTPEEAVRLGLANNFALALVRDQTELAALNRRAGLGPFLPTAAASATYAGAFRADDTARTTVGVSANLQLFNGFQSTFAYRRLKAQESAAGASEQAAVESTVESILGAYYDVARQKLQGAAIREALAVSRERAELARARQEVGAGSRLENLQAQADLNADSSALMTQENTLRAARIRLNGLLARDAATAFDVPDTIPVEAALPLAAWRGDLAERNASVREARVQLTASEYSLKEARGARLPSLSGGVGYSTAPDALNRAPSRGTDDVTYSLNLTLPLFDGLRTHQSVGASRLGVRRQQTGLKQVEQEVQAAFADAEGRYLSGLRQIALEERNLDVTRLQAEAARERYRVGASSPLEFRDAQQRLLDARVRLAGVRLSTKQSELALKRLAGALAAPVPTEN